MKIFSCISLHHYMHFPCNPSHLHELNKPANFKRGQKCKSMGGVKAVRLVGNWCHTKM